MSKKFASPMEPMSEGEGKHTSGATFTAFAEDTSFHGLKHTVDKDKGLVRRILWTLSFLTACAYLIYQLTTLLMLYYSYPYRTVNSVKPVTAYQFPTVTICDLNVVDSTMMNYSAEIKTIYRTVESGLWSALLNSTIDELHTREPYKTLLDSQYLPFITAATPKVQDSVFYCTWEEKSVNCEDILTKVQTPTGMCFRFNHDGSDPKIARRSGAKGGLLAVFKVNQKGYTLSEFNAAGYKVLLHQMFDYADTASRGLLLSPGFHYDISFQTYTYKYLPKPFKALSDRYCSNPSSSEYDNAGNEYSLSACIHSRADTLATETCGCGVQNCTLYKYLTCYKSTFYDIYQNATEGGFLGCPYPCRIKMFLPIISQAYTPTTDAKNLIRFLEPTIQDDEIRATYMSLNLYFDDLIVRESEHVPEYDSLSLFGAIGGNMGLFLGASLLTLAEVVDFMFIYIYSLLERFKCFCCGGQRIQAVKQWP